MRNWMTRGAFLAGAVAALLAPSATVPVQADEEQAPPLDRETQRLLDRAIKDILRSQKRDLNSILKQFKGGAKNTRGLLGGDETQQLSAFPDILSHLDFGFGAALDTTRNSIGQIDDAVFDIFAGDPTLPDISAGLGAGPKHSVAGAIDTINANNVRFCGKLAKVMGGVEKASRRTDFPIVCDIIGLPTFIPPQVGRGMGIPGRQSHRVDILYTVAGANGPTSRGIVLGGAAEPNGLGGRVPYVRRFDAQGNPVDDFTGSPRPNGYFFAGFNDPPGSCVGISGLSVALDDPLGDPSMIFADGFESGDTSSWSTTNP